MRLLLIIIFFLIEKSSIERAVETDTFIIKGIERIVI